MAITVEATYENGVLKLDKPLPLQEGEKVRLIIEPRTNWVHESSGLPGATIDPETIRRIAEDPEFSLLEAYDQEELKRCANPFGPPSSPSPPV